MHRTFERYPFLKEDFPFPEEFYARVGKAPELLAATGYVPADDRAADGRARPLAEDAPEDAAVHHGDALAALVRDKRTQDVIVNQTRFIARQGIVFEPEELAGQDRPRAIFRPYLDVFRDLPAPVREKAVLYMTVGSLNKDARGMMTDGEVLQVTAGAWAMWAVADMWILTGSTTWIESQEELDQLLPPYSQLQRRIGRWVRKVI